jgi:hypothetical protein
MDFPARLSLCAGQSHEFRVKDLGTACGTSHGPDLIAFAPKVFYEHGSRRILWPIRPKCRGVRPRLTFSEQPGIARCSSSVVPDGFRISRI